MAIVNIHAAKAQLSGLVDTAAAGKEIIVARAGNPVALNAPDTKPERVLGTLAGQLRVPADFDAPLPADEPAAFD